MTIEQLQAIHEADAGHRGSADPDGGRLAKALGRNLLDDLRGERGRARHDADLAGPLEVRRHDADLAAPRHHDALRVGPDEPAARAYQAALHAHTVEHRTEPGAADPHTDTDRKSAGQGKEG